MIIKKPFCGFVELPNYQTYLDMQASGELEDGKYYFVKDALAYLIFQGVLPDETFLPSDAIIGSVYYVGSNKVLYIQTLEGYIKVGTSDGDGASITIDSIPIEGSTNAVMSSGVYKALADVSDKIGQSITNAEILSILEN